MKPNIIQFLTYSATSSSMIFIPLFAEEFGASDFEIGIIGGVYGFTMFFSSYVFGRMSDVYGRKMFLLIGLFACAVSFPLQALAFSPLALCMARGFVGFSLGIYPAALVTYVYESKRRLGRFTGFGSLGWAVGNFAAGIIAVYWEIFMLGSVFFTAAFLIALKMDVPKTRLKVSFFPANVIKKNFSVYLSFFLRHTGAQAVWIIFPLYILSLGASKFWVGALYFINTFTQFLVMQKIDRFKSHDLVVTGLVLSAFTFLSFTLAPNFYWLIPTQILLGFSWSCIYVGSLKFVMEKNIEKATSSGLLNSTTSLSAIIGPITGGALSLCYGYKSTMYFASVLTVAGLMVFYFLSILGKRFQRFP
ncbi:MAG: MFS transporter [Thermoplasmatales archaeon]|nr:MFS transporter [Thermoplasmatales archaeon]